MKNRIFFLMIMLATVLVAIGQNTDVYETQYFSRMDMLAYNGDKMVFLYEKGNTKKPYPLDENSRIEDTSQLFLFLGELVQKEFSDLNSVLMDALGKVTISFCYDVNGTIPFYYITLAEDLYKSIPNLESGLYHIIASLRCHGVKGFELSFADETRCGQVWIILRSAFRAVPNHKDHR